MKQEGFTLIEILIVLAVIAILLGVIIPSFRGMREEGYRARTQKEVETVQVAVESYYKNYASYPPSMSVLTTVSPKMIVKIPEDPFNTSGNNLSYMTANDANFGDWYMVGSRGPDRSWQSSYNSGESGWDVIGDDILATNTPKYDH